MKLVIPYEPWHLHNLIPRLQAKQPLSETEQDTLAGALENAWSLSDGTNIYSIIGVQTRDQGVGRAWALFAGDVGVDMLPIIRAVRLWLKVQTQFHRVEILTRVDFPEAARFAQLTGFTCEARLGCYNVDRSDCFMWSRLRGVRSD